ncbi:MAG: hypothetical protein ACK5NY_02350, partial [Burkholderiaceae bacterium]
QTFEAGFDKTHDQSVGVCARAIAKISIARPQAANSAKVREERAYPGYPSSTVVPLKHRFLDRRPNSHAGLRSAIQKLLWWHAFIIILILDIE